MSKKSGEKQRQQIKDYLRKNPVTRGERGCYDNVAKMFNVDKEYVRNIFKDLRQSGEVADEGVEKQFKRSFRENVQTGEATVTTITKKRIVTLEDLLEACEVDPKIWSVDTWEATKWEVGRKDKKLDITWNKGVMDGYSVDTGKIFVEPLYRVNAKFKRKTLAKDLQLQKEAILAELRDFSSNVTLSTKDRYNFQSKDHLLEICVFDAHFGKLAWREETNEDYDLKIAEKRVKEAISGLLSRVDLNCVERILFPIGNDMINVDNRNNTTTAGTPQDTDVRFMKIMKNVRRILIEIVNELSAIAPVDVVVVPGNHDTTASFMIGEILDAFFYHNERVNVDNSPKMRKYYRYGLNSFQLTHGNEEKHESLGLIFATEEARLWSDTKFRFCQVGHFHKNKKMNFVSIDEHQGFSVQVMPSLSGTDAWHFKKGYNTMKQAKALLYSKTEGLVGEFTKTV